MAHEDYTYGDPCPECGEERRFGETCLSHGVVYMDDDGNPKHFSENELGETMVVECLECGTMLLDKLND